MYFYGNVIILTVSPSSFIRSIITGQLFREFNISADGKARLDIPGGNLLFASIGYRIWETDAGLISRVGENYPHDWLKEIESSGFDIRGIKILPTTIDHRLFTAHQNLISGIHDNPVTHFIHYGYTFPTALLGYTNPFAPSKDIRQVQKTTLMPGDFPLDYLEASAIYIGSLDFISQTNLLSISRNNKITSILLESSAGLMDSIFWDELPMIIHGLTVFITDEIKIRKLFSTRLNDLWEMAEKISSLGCEIVIIKSQSGSQFIYDHKGNKKWQVPLYPTRMINATGVGDAISGGFLAGFRRNYDPLEAALFGSISGSLVGEGNTPFYALNCLKGLPEARLCRIKDLVRRL
jgi:hypothetical protein